MTPLDALDAASASSPATLIAACAAVIAAVAALVRGHGSQVAEQLKDLRTRVTTLEKDLKAERELRETAVRERDEERTGKFAAIERERNTLLRLEQVERDADRRIREALRAVEHSAQERARWEARAKWARDELDRHVRETTSGHSTPGHEPDAWAKADTWPPRG